MPAGGLASRFGSQLPSAAGVPPARTGLLLLAAFCLIVAVQTAFILTYTHRSDSLYLYSPLLAASNSSALQSAVHACLRRANLTRGHISFYSGLPHPRPRLWDSMSWAGGRQVQNELSAEQQAAVELDPVVAPHSQCSVSQLYDGSLSGCDESSCLLDSSGRKPWDLFAPRPPPSPFCPQRAFSWLDADNILHMCCAERPRFLQLSFGPGRSRREQYKRLVRIGNPLKRAKAAYMSVGIPWRHWAEPHRVSAAAVLAICGDRFNWHFPRPSSQQAEVRALALARDWAEQGDSWAPAVALGPPLTGMPPAWQRPAPLNIVVFMLDSVSRLALMHYMPRTASWLQRLQAGWDSEHVAVMTNRQLVLGANSPPNQVPLYSGHKCFQSNAKIVACTPPSWVWETASTLGYVTAMFHEQCRTFAGSRLGFQEGKDTLDLHPPGLQCANEQHPAYGMPSAWLPVCAGQETMATHLMKRTLAQLQHASRMGTPIFLSSTTASAHSSYWPAMADMDIVMPEFLQSLLDVPNTAVLFLSDHGNNHSPVVTTQLGQLELLLPFVSLLLPRSSLPPAQLQRLQRNMVHMTTPYDWHVTLRQLLALPFGRAVVAADHYNGMDYGRSYNLLTEDIPSARSCTEAGLWRVFCPCGKSSKLPASDDLRILGGAVMDALHAKLTEQATDGPCEQLQLLAIEDASYLEESGRITLLLRTAVAAQGLQQLYIAMFVGSRPGSRGFSLPTTSLELLKQVSRWADHKGCTPKGVHPQYCVCNSTAEGGLQPLVPEEAVLLV
eukprot:PLAT9586.1.p1 GENE.PLAT9586.1~~PLAT9586.1.p1  ORF type:complete len:820 (+),score=331.54 PLAT9586.1:119-2461(+)